MGRAPSLAAVNAALASEEQEIILVAQRSPQMEEPTQDDLYTIGTRAIIRRFSKGEEHMEVFCLGVERIVVIKVETGGEYPVVRFSAASSTGRHRRGSGGAAACGIGADHALHSTDAKPGPGGIGPAAGRHGRSIRLVFLVASMLSLDLPKAQALLEASTRLDALRMMHTYLSYEVQVLELRNKIATDARTEIDNSANTCCASNCAPFRPSWAIRVEINPRLNR